MEIILKNIVKDYGTEEVLHDINLNLSLDEISVIGLVGPNGAGKSTLMRLLGGIILENDGEIFLNSNEGRKDNYSSWARKNSFYIPAGDRGLRNKLSLKDNLRYFGALRGVKVDINSKRIQNLINTFNVEKLIDKQFDTMSTGQKKKASIFVGLALTSKVLLLDEPSNGLDLEAQAELMKTISEVNKKSEKKIIISSHDSSLLSDVVDQYYFIGNGKLVKVVEKKLSEQDLINEYSKS